MDLFEKTHTSLVAAADAFSCSCRDWISCACFWMTSLSEAISIALSAFWPKNRKRSDQLTA